MPGWGIAAKSLAKFLAGTGALYVVTSRFTDPVEYDPEESRARDGAPRPGGEKGVRDAMYLCETTGKGCDASDLRDWLHTYRREIDETQDLARNLARVASSGDSESLQLLGQLQEVDRNFQATYGAGWRAFSIPGGGAAQYFEEIQKVNQRQDALYSLAKKINLRIYDLRPGHVMAGYDGPLQPPPPINATPYVAAGAVAGLGLALAFVMASNKKKASRSGY
jgi:hypothetical protein